MYVKEIAGWQTCCAIVTNTIQFEWFCECFVDHNHLRAHSIIWTSISIERSRPSPREPEQNVINLKETNRVIFSPASAKLRQKKHPSMPFSWGWCSASLPRLSMGLCTIIAFTCTTCVNFVVLHIERVRCFFVCCGFGFGMGRYNFNTLRRLVRELKKTTRKAIFKKMKSKRNICKLNSFWARTTDLSGGWIFTSILWLFL